MVDVESERVQELVKRERNSLARLQTGGLLSPCPLSVAKFGYKSFIDLGLSDQRRVIRRQYEDLFGKPGKNQSK